MANVTLQSKALDSVEQFLATTEKVTLALTPKEALAVSLAMQWVGGEPGGTWRKYADSVGIALCDAGVDIPYPSDSGLLKGQIVALRDF